MRKVIDLECDLPPDENGNPRKLEAATHPPGYGDPERLEPLPGHGFSNYERIFTRRTEGGPSPEPAKKHGMSIADFVTLMDRAGVEVGVLRAGNAIIADVLAQYPKRFIGLATISPHDGMRGVRELVRLVQDHGFGALRVSALYNMVEASDRRYYPLYAKCVELDIPVRIYTNMNYATDRPYDLGHPRHLDQIAVDFPELRIVAGLSGWPWINDMVALLRRHPNLYCDTASHRPRYFGVPGSGWARSISPASILPVSNSARSTSRTPRTPAMLCSRPVSRRSTSTRSALTPTCCAHSPPVRSTARSLGPSRPSTIATRARISRIALTGYDPACRGVGIQGCGTGRCRRGSDEQDARRWKLRKDLQTVRTLRAAGAVQGDDRTTPASGLL